MQTSKDIVEWYGVHHDHGKAAWLEQGRGGVNALGLHARSPFVVHPPHGRHCNHQINLATPIPNDRHWELFMRLQADPAVRAMMPFPKADAGVYYIEDRPRLIDFLVMLSRMSSPIFPVAVPFWSFDRPSLLKALGESNVQPLVVFGATVDDISTVREVAQAAVHRPRKLIMTGLKEIALPAVVKKIDTQLTTATYDFNELNALPWDSLAATALRKWMRHEWAAERTTLRVAGKTGGEA